MRKIGTALIASVLSLAMAPAFAQDAPRLSFSGDVMVSSGGEFVSAANGQVVMPGQTFMVERGSAATLSYPGNCAMSYNVPGTYRVPDVCNPAMSHRAADRAVYATDWVAVGIVAGTVAAVAAGLAAMDDVDAEPPPLSP